MTGAEAITYLLFGVKVNAHVLLGQSAKTSYPTGASPAFPVSEAGDSRRSCTTSRIGFLTWVKGRMDTIFSVIRFVSSQTRRGAFGLPRHFLGRSGDRSFHGGNQHH